MADDRYGQAWDGQAHDAKPGSDAWDGQSVSGVTDDKPRSGLDRQRYEAVLGRGAEDRGPPRAEPTPALRQFRKSDADTVYHAPKPSLDEMPMRRVRPDEAQRRSTGPSTGRRRSGLWT